MADAEHERTHMIVHVFDVKVKVNLGKFGIFFTQ